MSLMGFGLAPWLRSNVKFDFASIRREPTKAEISSYNNKQASRSNAFNEIDNFKILMKTWARH